MFRVALMATISLLDRTSRKVVTMQRVRVTSVVLCAILHLSGPIGCGSPDSSGSGATMANVGGSGAHSSSSTSSPPSSSTGGDHGYTVDSTGGTPCVRSNGTAPPGCGDGIVQADRGEQCDDGNTVAGDGCSGTCQIEPNHTCPPRGGRCEVSFRCGDGVVNPGEACDEGDFQGQPGCSNDCTQQSPGYNCVPGQACVPLFTCGNNRIEQGETCDPPNPGNGCGLDCQTEDGWRCQPGSCTRLPYCGDGIIQATLGEVCDQGAHRRLHHQTWLGLRHLGLSPN